MNAAIKRIRPKASKGNLWRFCLALMLLFGTLSGTPAFAHHAHAGLTEIATSKVNQDMEITHRLYAHDLEPRLFYKVMSGWEETPIGIEKVGEYCDAKFKIFINGKRLPLNYVGAEPDGEFIYVYFTAPRPHAGDTLYVDDTLLQDAFDDQVNLVNLTLNGQTQSQYFRFGEKAKSFIWSVPSSD
jgi:Domain of unknown function (DUF6702)